mgnify:CR=1 FL=1|tara:strand:- start:52527 stop:52904 length:378 start_codon:yes stop_codon:yes gene_type:complete
MWKKKLREYKGKFEKYSIRNKLNREKKINSNFEVILNSLTLEEIIALKLELACSHVNHKFYGFPIFRSIKYLVREACLMFALSATRTPKDAANLLGISERQLYEEIEKFELKPEDCNYELPDDTN